MELIATDCHCLPQNPQAGWPHRLPPHMWPWRLWIDDDCAEMLRSQVVHATFGKWLTFTKNVARNMMFKLGMISSIWEQFPPPKVKSREHAARKRAMQVMKSWSCRAMRHLDAWQNVCMPRLLDNPARTPYNSRKPGVQSEDNVWIGTDGNEKARDPIQLY